jgi:TonB-linked SusC/RagA family outer membrane protein
MRLTTVLLIVALAHVSGVAHGQITLKEKNVPIEKVLSLVEKQTKYVFLYDPDDLKMGPVTVEVKNASLEETLRKCFGEEPITFTLIENNVLLKRKQTASPQGIAGTRTRGKIVDESGQPLAAVTVINKRELNGTITDSSGGFSIAGRKGDVLRFSSIGYKDEEVRVGDKRSIDVMLAINPASPEQVVVIGYGSSKKKDLTGSVSIVDVRDMSEISYNTFDNALAGKAPGVQVIKTDGTPGGMVRVRIRGTSSLIGGNDPLYVIDGIPVQVRDNYIDPGYAVASTSGNLTGNNGTSTGSGVALPASFVNSLNGLGGVNPDDIESISVLKDASSTAIYGSKAANGVVIITTRTGTTNTPTRVGAQYYTTVNSLYRPPRLLNATQYQTLLKDAAQHGFESDTAQGYSGGYFTTILDSPSFFGPANTNWTKQVTNTTVSNNVGLSISGGGPTSKYFSSFAYSSTPGVLDGTSYQRITGKISLETAISPKLKIASNLMLGFTNQDISDGAYMQALLARPDLKPRDSLGQAANFDALGGQIQGFINPVALVNATNNGKTLSLLGSVSGTYAILRNLRFRSAVSLNMQTYNQRNYLPSYIDIETSGYNRPDPGGIGSDANSRFADWFLENTLSYDQQFNSKHALHVVIGQSYETTKYSWFRTTAAGFPNDDFLNGLSSASTVVGVAGDDPRSPQSYLLSFYARTNYSYMDKYLFTFTGRTDGSSKFGPENKYGYFPSGAIAWRISRERFLEKVRWINDIKLRGSYGLTGNQNIGDQMYRTLYNTVSYAGSSAVVPVQLGNSGIKWESTKETGAGLDLAFLNNRLNATFDYYNRQTDDALLTLPIASSSSFTSLLENTAGLRNRGYEVSIGGDLIRTRNFRWTVSINVTWNKSLVTRLDSLANLSQIVSPTGLENNFGTGGRPSPLLLKQGKPLGLISGEYITGLIRSQADLDAYNKHLGIFAKYPPHQIGDAMYRLDTSTAAMGYEQPATNQVIGNGPEKYYGGMTQEFSYKNVSLQCYFTFSHGGHLLWAQHVATTEFFNNANANVSMFNRYTPSNTTSNQPVLNLSESYTPTNLDVFSSSYLKLRALTLNYHFNDAFWMKQSGIKNLQVFASATNVFTITKYPGSDPEVSDDPYYVGGGYVDAGIYPALRTFTFGLKAVF